MRPTINFIRPLLFGVVILSFMPVANAGHTNTVIAADLDGREEVDDSDPTNRLAGDPDGQGKGYVFGVDGDPTTLCYLLEVSKILLVPVGEGMAAHIHEGVRDANGPVVAVLAGPEDGNAADCLTEGEMGKFPTGESGIVQRILANPTQFYVNVHNPEFPAGAIRGNLKFQLEHSHDDEEPTVPETGAPSVPANLRFTAYSSTALELFWDRSVDDGIVVAYRVYRDGDFDSEVEGNSYFAEGLARGTNYQYTVEAVDGEGNRSKRSEAISVQTR